MKNEKLKIEDNVGVIKELTKELLGHLLVKATVEVSEDKEGQAFKIQIESEDSGYLIGYHGETIEALQLILSLMVYKKLGTWQRLVVNVGNYRQQREEQLKKLALNVAQKVKFSGEEQVIPDLLAGERRIIHLALRNHPDVYTESEGESDKRTLIVRPKKK
jgi:spoIIIJ-associated protein